MTERPILFNGEMVRAIMDGRKTQTRRVVKPQPPSSEYQYWVRPDGVCTDYFTCPYGHPGDWLWVRETFGYDPYHAEIGHEQILYRATFRGDPDYPVKWRPSIHMPRWASRLTLEVTSVRVERVQEVTEADAQCEGWSFQNHPLNQRYDPVSMDTARRWFRDLWDSINAARGYSWDSNPWVWVVEFRRLP